MYKPQQPSIPKSLQESIIYSESTPNESNNTIAYCYWGLRTKETLGEDFQYLVLPDACIDIVFDIDAKPSYEGALVMTPHKAVTTVNLGKSFSFVGIRLLPGAWLRTPQEIIGEMTYFTKLAETNLVQLQQELSNAIDTSQRDTLMDTFLQACKEQKLVGRNALAQLILKNADTITSVNDILDKTSYSRRHIQRMFKEEVGYSPHDFLKIIRFQQAISERDNHMYTDQSHYIKEFKRITNMTPGTYWKKF